MSFCSAKLPTQRRPSAATGACATIEDSVTAVELLTSTGGLDRALEDFQAARKRQAEQVVQKGRQMQRLQMPHSAFAAWLRDEAFQHMPPNTLEKVAEEMASGTG